MAIRTVELPSSNVNRGTDLLATVAHELNRTAARAGTVAEETLQFVITEPATTSRIHQLRQQEATYRTAVVIGIALIALCFILAATGGVAAIPVLAIGLVGLLVYAAGYAGLRFQPETPEKLLAEAKDDAALQKRLQHAVYDAEMTTLRDLAKHEKFVTRYNLGPALQDRFVLAAGNIPTALPAVIAA